MKKNVMLLVALCAIALVQLKAQDFDPLSKGSRVVGGGIDLNILGDDTEPSSNNNDRFRTTEGFEISFRPSVGKFVRDRLAVGGSLFISSLNNDVSDENTAFIISSENQNFTLGVGVFLRKYYPIIGKFGAFIQPEWNISTFSSETENSQFDKFAQVTLTRVSSEFDGWQTSIGANLGLYVLLGKKFSLETNLGSLTYNYSRLDIENESTATSEPLADERTISRLNLNLIDEISLDRLLVINFFF